VVVLLNIADRGCLLTYTSNKERPQTMYYDIFRKQMDVYPI